MAEDFYAQINAPVLGICYGMQLLAKDLRGAVSPSEKREYGPAKLKILSGETRMFTGLPFELDGGRFLRAN